MADGLNSELGDITASSVAGTAAVSGGQIASGGVGAVHMASNAASGNIVGTAFATVKAGSPPAGGASVQYGTVTANDAAVWTAFGSAFKEAPKVVIGLAESGAAATQPGTLVTSHAGSFSMLGTSGLAYHWIAAGSGRV